MKLKASIILGNGESQLRFALTQIAGLPLITRNLLTLHKMGYRELYLTLPKNFAAKVKKAIQSDLQLRKVKVHFLSEQTSDLNETYDLEVAADAFIDEKLPTPHFLVTLDSQDKVKVIEAKLLENIRQSTPGPVAKHLNKRISLPISLQLAKWGMHPHAVSMFNIIVGFSTGIFVSVGQYWAYLLGAFLFQMASVFDGCDGELAKLRFRTSKQGEYLDSISDNGALLSFFIGLSFAFAKQHSFALTFQLGLFLFSGLGLLFWQMISFLKKYTQSASLVAFHKEYLDKLDFSKSPLLGVIVKYGKILMRKDCFSLAFFFFALFGMLPWLFYIAASALWMTNFVLIRIKTIPEFAFKKVSE